MSKRPTTTNPLPSLFNPESERVCHCVSNCLDAAVNSAAQPFQRTKNDRTNDERRDRTTDRDRTHRHHEKSGPAEPCRIGRGGVGCCRRAKKKERKKRSNGRRTAAPSPRIRKCCSEDGARTLIGKRESERKSGRERAAVMQIDATIGLVVRKTRLFERGEFSRWILLFLPPCFLPSRPHSIPLFSRRSPLPNEIFYVRRYLAPSQSTTTKSVLY